MDNKQLLANLIAKPEKVRPEHVPMLQEMLVQYPYAQVIHVLLAKADAQFISKAALYSNRNILYSILQTTADSDVSEQEDILVEENNEEEVFEEIRELDQDIIEPSVAKTDLTRNIHIETPNNLPGTDQHLMDSPPLEDTFVESVVATDFFAFEQKLSTDVIAEAPEIETVVPDEPEINFVSRYDDDQLPYTFLWWLAKTRKEHEQIFQPYAQPKPGLEKQQPPVQKQSGGAEFQQQYVEHIFHIQTPFEVADHLAEYPTAELKDAKGAEIIDKFLKEDPTIKPPKPEQIDNENKAKKSAEDHYDLVSETLAKIYIEQMLYHKAIDTYKKLSLKYPEKSRYFADLIQSIEKKF
ncbi:hypothetical protein [Pedobacter punctiformis]|uniref:Tetratricopeptide repeat protein n=1 Tax=Pedobacter punctiformis TaxID=3004097 RepID=A0ABT4L5A4_9SPHI|nr:hypothetical protein [Pedobacter sp. HCMS5-2]MCZ4243091.1 hypothetical protein [Pedobacter sp. HCMS5-2]